MLIYKITNKLDGKIYIGQTIKTAEARFKQHCYKSKAVMYIGRAIRLHGKENFSLEVVEYCSSYEEMNQKEEYYIQHFSSLFPNGYNIEMGGLNFKRARGTRTGCKLTDETKLKMSLAAKGKPRSPEYRAKISKSLSGRKLSEERINAMRGKRVGEPKKGYPVLHIPTGKVFDSVSEACRILELPLIYVHKVLKSGDKKSKYNNILKYVKEV